MGNLMNSRLQNLTGYGSKPPHPKWPNNAQIAINFVVNYEEGSESNILDGDPSSENYLAEIANMTARQGARSYFSESIFNYGARAGIWRLLNIFDKFKIPITVFATGQALERNLELGATLSKSNHEIVGHGYRWINYHGMSIEEERKHIQLTIDAIKKHTGKTPIGWYTGRHSENTRSLVVEAGLKYDSDDYSDDLPFWTVVDNKPHLIVPYTFDNNDSKYSMNPGWMSGDDFFRYLCSSFDCLHREGETSPKMMTVALHGRLSGRPGRAEALNRFIEYIKKYNNVWICTRSDIANHWMEKFPFNAEAHQAKLQLEMASQTQENRYT